MVEQQPRKSVIARVAKAHGITKVESERILRTALEGIAEEIALRGRFHVAEIGSITAAPRRPRRYFNPRTLREAVSDGDVALKISISKKMRAKMLGRLG